MWKNAYDNFKRAHTDSERLVSSLFSDPDFVKTYVDPDGLMWGFYWIASDMQNVETELSFYDLFTPATQKHN